MGRVTTRADWGKMPMRVSSPLLSLLRRIHIKSSYCSTGYKRLIISSITPHREFGHSYSSLSRNSTPPCFNLVTNLSYHRWISANSTITLLAPVPGTPVDANDDKKLKRLRRTFSATNIGSDNRLGVATVVDEDVEMLGGGNVVIWDITTSSGSMLIPKIAPVSRTLGVS